MNILFSFVIIVSFYLVWISDCRRSLTIKKFETFFARASWYHFKGFITCILIEFLSIFILYSFRIRKTWRLVSLLDWNLWIEFHNIKSWWVVILNNLFTARIFYKAIGFYISFSVKFILFLSHFWCFNLLILYFW